MNEGDVRLTYRRLAHKNETEIRAIAFHGKGKPLSYFVSDEDSFVARCRLLESSGVYNIYCGINERLPGGTKGEDVISVNQVVIDIDPVRPVGTASTDTELQYALDVARQLQARLSAGGIGCSLAMSGNGAQLWIPAYIPKERWGSALAGIRDFQRAMIAENPDPEHCKIDSIGDSARIIKVIGTLSIKGMNEAGRPWRISCWIDRDIPPISSEFMQKLMSWKSETAETESGHEGVKEKLQKLKVADRKFDALFSGRLQEVLNAEGKKYQSRSEVELAVVIKLVQAGFSDSEIDAAMDLSAIGKWQESDKSYKLLTIKKAREATFRYRTMASGREIRYSVDGAFVRVYFRYDKALVSLLKAIGSRWDADAGCWLVVSEKWEALRTYLSRRFDLRRRGEQDGAEAGQTPFVKGELQLIGFVRDVPEFIWRDGRTYSFEKEDVANLSMELAEHLIKNNFGKLIVPGGS